MMSTESLGSECLSDYVSNIKPIPQTTNMIRHYLLIILLPLAIHIAAQGRYCYSYDDFVAGQWVEIPTIQKIDNSTSHQFWSGSGDYTITFGDKAINKVLKKEVLVVELRDTLYVNLRTLRYKNYKLGKGFTRAVRLGDDKLAFVAKRMGVDMGFFFGVVGSAISGYYSMKNKVCYILDNNGNGKKRQVKMLDDSAYKDALLESEQ